jgi:nitrate reductase molybdenum cofactor assembly chaperone
MRQQIHNLFALFLDYPSPALPRSVNQLLSLLREGLPEHVLAIEAFQNALEKAGISRFQELYIQTFDFRADCSLYVGHYLFGESGRRGAFLAELSDRYRERQFPATGELPDHMSCLLRYLSALEPGEEASELIHGCLIPALSRITAANAIAKSPYRLVLEALLAILRQKDGDHSDSGEFAWTSSSSSPFPILR